MASAINWRTRPEATPRPSDDVHIPRLVNLLGVLAFSLPYLLLGWLVQNSLFLSDTRARLLGRILMAIGDARLENIILNYPLFPSLVAALRPAPSTLMIASALTAGATLWLLWQTLANTQFNVFVRAILLFAFAAVPTTAFLATQSFGEMLALLLLLIAWNYFVAFVRTNTTWKAFVAGLVIGLAFFVSLHALVYGLVFVISAPFYLYQHGEGTLSQQRPRILTGTIVIAFPLVVAFLAWTYLCWIFTGEPFIYTRDVVSPLAAFRESPTAPLLGLQAVLNASFYDVLRLPLYILVGILTAIYAPHRLATFLVPLVIITVLRALGWSYGEPFALATMSLVALAGIPLQRRLGWVLVPAAALQIFLAYGVEYRSVEQNEWKNVLLTNSAAVQDDNETELARWLAALPPNSVLIDSRAAYRLIARMGTAAPLVGADAPEYQLAVSAPADYVDYILVTEGDQLAQRFDLAPPAGFTLDNRWLSGRLYRRNTLD
jgi:hypothetical protein